MKFGANCCLGVSRVFIGCANISEQGKKRYIVVGTNNSKWRRKPKSWFLSNSCEFATPNLISFALYTWFPPQHRVKKPMLSYIFHVYLKWTQWLHTPTYPWRNTNRKADVTPAELSRQSLWSRSNFYTSVIQRFTSRHFTRRHIVDLFWRVWLLGALPVLFSGASVKYNSTAYTHGNHHQRNPKRSLKRKGGREKEEVEGKRMFAKNSLWATHLSIHRLQTIKMSALYPSVYKMNPFTCFTLP